MDFGRLIAGLLDDAQCNEDERNKTWPRAVRSRASKCIAFYIMHELSSLWLRGTVRSTPKWNALVLVGASVCGCCVVLASLVPSEERLRIL